MAALTFGFLCQVGVVEDFMEPGGCTNLNKYSTIQYSSTVKFFTLKYGSVVPTVLAYLAVSAVGQLIVGLIYELLTKMSRHRQKIY